MTYTGSGFGYAAFNQQFIDSGTTCGGEIVWKTADNGAWLSQEGGYYRGFLSANSCPHDDALVKYYCLTAGPSDPAGAYTLYINGGSPAGTITLDTPAAPVVTTDSATDIVDTGATLNGEITDIGSGDADLRGFVYGTTTESDPGDTAPGSTAYSDYTQESGTFGAATFLAAITGLSPSTTYYARAYAHNGDGYSYGDEISFDTDALPPFRFENIQGVVFDPDDNQTIYAERLNDMLDRLDALDGG